MNPERDENDAEFEDATKEIEQLNVTNIRHENTIAELQSRLDAREKGAAEMMADVRSCADFLGRDGYTRWRNMLLNIEQSIAAPETYRRLP